jgi:hypothetical protein
MIGRSGGEFASTFQEVRPWVLGLIGFIVAALVYLALNIYGKSEPTATAQQRHSVSYARPHTHHQSTPQQARIPPMMYQSTPQQAPVPPMYQPAPVPPLMQQIPPRHSPESFVGSLAFSQ